MALTRDDAMRLDAPDPLAAFRDRFVIADEHRLYLDGNSLGRLPKGTRDRLHRVIDQWGEELVGGWHDWIEAPDAHRRRARRGARREPRRGARHRLDHGQPLQARQRDAGRRPVAAHAGHRPRQLPDRPLRARGDRPRPRPGAADLRGRRPAARPAARRPPRTASSCSRHVAYRSGALADIAAFDRARRHLGPLPLRRRGAGRPATRTASATPSAAPTSTSTPARAPPATSTCASPSRSAAHADPGLVRPGRPVRDGAPVRARARHHAASWPARRRSSCWPRSRRACGSPPRRGSRRCARSRSPRPS